MCALVTGVQTFALPISRPVAGRRPERRMAEVGEHALTCEPMRGGGDEYLMLVIADEPPAAEHRQRPRDDKAARAAAEFDDDRRAQCLDRVDDMRQEAGVGFPTAELRQRIFGKVEAAQQRGLPAIGRAWCRERVGPN